METSELSSGVSAAGKGTLEGRVRSGVTSYQHGVIFLELRATALACLAAVSWPRCPAWQEQPVRFHQEELEPMVA